MAYFKPHLYLNYQKHPISLGLHSIIADKKKFKSVSTSGDIARQQAVKLGLCVCISTAQHSSKYTNFLDGMNVAESCIA